MDNDGYKVGYCTNVHAGATLEATKANLQRHALAVKRLYSPDQPMGVGLWLSARAAEELLGRVLAADPGRRSRMVLATKGGILPPVP